MDPQVPISVCGLTSGPGGMYGECWGPSSAILCGLGLLVVVRECSAVGSCRTVSGHHREASLRTLAIATTEGKYMCSF